MIHDDGNSKYFCNVGGILWDYVTKHPRRKVTFILATDRT
jgi:hypothetical protein